MAQNLSKTPRGKNSLADPTIAIVSDSLNDPDPTATLVHTHESDENQTSTNEERAGVFNASVSRCMRDKRPVELTVFAVDRKTTV